MNMSWGGSGHVVRMALDDRRVCSHQEAGKRMVLWLVMNCFRVQCTFRVSLEPRIGPDVSPDRMAKRADSALSTGIHAFLDFLPAL